MFISVLNGSVYVKNIAYNFSPQNKLAASPAKQGSTRLGVA
jgi:hypothetical protein